MKESRQCREFRLAPGVLSELVDGLSRSYADGYGVNPAGGANLPRRREILSVLAKDKESPVTRAATACLGKAVEYGLIKPSQDGK